MAPRKKKRILVTQHSVGAYPNHLITLIYSDATFEYYVTDARKPQNERTLLRISPEDYDRLVRAAHAESTDNIGYFISQILGAVDDEDDGETIFTAPEKTKEFS